MPRVRRTAGSNKAKHMPSPDPAIGALKSLGERPRVKLLHHLSAGIQIQRIAA